MAQFDFGVIGLGGMGGGMAASLARAGLRVCGVDPAQNAREQAAAKGVTICTDLTTLLTSAEIVVISLAGMAAQDSVYRSMSEMPPETTQMIIETSTVAPQKAVALAEISAASGRRHLEAALIGLPQDAQAASLFQFVGGSAEDVAQAAPFLTATGRAFTHLGAVGSAATVKVLNNAIGNATMLAFTEAIVAAETLGVDPAAFVTAVTKAGGAGLSVVFERHAARALAGSAPQPPTPINRKDMEELRRMLAPHLVGFNLFEAAISIAMRLPEDPGMVRARADALRAKISQG